MSRSEDYWTDRIYPITESPDDNWLDAPEREQLWNAFTSAPRRRCIAVSNGERCKTILSVYGTDDDNVCRITCDACNRRAMLDDLNIDHEKIQHDAFLARIELRRLAKAFRRGKIQREQRAERYMKHYDRVIEIAGILPKRFMIGEVMAKMPINHQIHQTTVRTILEVAEKRGVVRRSGLIGRRPSWELI